MGLRFGILLFLLFSIPRVHAAGWALQLAGTYSTDNFTSSTVSTSALMYYGSALMLSLDKKGTFYLGYHYGSTSHSTSFSGVTGAFTTTDMGPFAAIYLNRSKSVSLTLGYNLQSTAKYTSSAATTAEEWSGTSYQAGLGFEQEFWEGIWLGAKLSMYSMSYSRNITLGATSSAISYTHSWMNPVFTIGFR